MVHTGERHRRQGADETVMPGMWSVQAGGLRLSRLGRVCRFCTPLSHAARPSSRARPYSTPEDDGEPVQVYDDYMKQAVQA